MTFWDFAAAHPIAAAALIPISWLWLTTAVAAAAGAWKRREPPRA